MASSLPPLRAIWTIARRELLEQLTSVRFVTILVLVVCLTPLAVYVGSRDYTSRLAEYSRLVAEKQETVSKQPMSVYGPGQRVIRAPEPLSVLVRGMDGALPAYWDFNESGSNEGPPSTRAKRLLDLLGQFDLEFVVRVVLGLLAILLAFDAVAGEKELGTLRAVLSNSVSRSAFLTGKLIGGSSTLLVALAAAMVLALVSAQTFGSGALSADNLVKTLLLGVTSAAYLLSLYSLGLFVSAFVTSQKTSLVVLLVTWVVLVLAAPPLATLIAQAVAPVTASHVTEAKKRSLDEDLREERDLEMGRILIRVAGDISGMGTNFYETASQYKEEINALAGPVRQAYAAKRRRLLGEVDRDAEQQATRQNGIARTIMSLSPAATFAGAATDLAGTGDAHRDSWTAAVRRQQSGLDVKLYENPAQMSFRMPKGDFHGIGNWGQRPTPADLPPFSPPRRDSATAIGSALPGLELLILYTGIFIAAGFVAFSRYDVR